MRIWARRLPTASPSDCSALQNILDRGEIDAAQVMAIIGKTEGNGGRNDFSRELAVRAFADCLAQASNLSREEIEAQVVLSFSGGTEGIVSPHVLVLARLDDGMPQPGCKRLAVAVAHTRDFAPQEVGRMAMVQETARVVRHLMQELAVADPADVHLVQIKGAIPAVSAAEQHDAAASGQPLRCDMVHSRAASALGVAVATGEVRAGEITDDSIARDFALYSSVASCSSKPGLQRSEIVLFANVSHYGGDLVMAHEVMQDIIDAEAVRAVLAQLGFETRGQLATEETERLVGIFAKADADPRGIVRGRRHTMWSDDDIDDTRHARAVVSSVLAAVTGETAVYVSTRAEHHGPLGGGPIAIMARVS
jgi:cyanuric acid amidohydrolase